MSGFRRRGTVSALIALAVAASAADRAWGQQTASDQASFRFRTAVELINVTATVTDSRGRFVSGLNQNDFTVYEDGTLQTVTHFSNERVPVSLGIVLDTSGSMEGEKIVSARRALERFLVDLLDPADEVFLYRFSDQPILVEQFVMGEPAAIISDGNDTSSATDGDDLKDLIRETEVLVYAIGIDGRGEPRVTVGRPPVPVPIPIPFPVPGRRPPVAWPPGAPPRSGGPSSTSSGDRVNVSALRDLTDDSGGRTEIIRDGWDLDPATAGIADELSKQYYLGYPARGLNDGRWHTIRVEVKNTNYLVRARRGYVATP